MTRQSLQALISRVIRYGLIMGGAAMPSYAAVNISPVPLTAATRAEPNLMMILDDSASMDFEIMMISSDAANHPITASDGVLWWNRSTSSNSSPSVSTTPGFTGWCIDDTYRCPNKVNIDTYTPLGGAAATGTGGNGDWVGYTYIFPNGYGGSGSSDKKFYHDESWPFTRAAPPIPQLGFVRDPEFNQGYFNPAIIYAPWPQGGGTTAWPNITASNAPADPVINSYKFNLTADIYQTGADLLFYLQKGMVIPSGTTIYMDTGYNNVFGSGTSATAVTGVSVSNKTKTTLSADATVSTPGLMAIQYFPATFCLKSTTALPVDTATITYGYASWNGTPYTAKDPTGASTLKCYEIKSANFNSTADYNIAIQNFANWFTYYRKRMQAARGAIVSSMTGLTNTRYGMFTISNRNTVTMNDLAVAAKRKTQVDAVYNTGIDGGEGTPNREAVLYAGKQFQRTDTDAPIQYACQANAAILLTDGYGNATDMSTATNGGIGNIDGGKGAPYQDNVAGTMADIASYFYNGSGTPLRGTSAFPTGSVPVPAACSNASPSPQLDCNKNLHWQFYGITLGASGDYYDPTITTASAYTQDFGNGVGQGPVQNVSGTYYPWWTDPAHVTTPSVNTVYTSYSPRMVDDLWHATVNAHGAMFYASDPQSITQQLSAAVSTFVQGLGSASAIASNSTRVSSTTDVYQARFNTLDWSGQVVAIHVNTDGSIGNTVWDTSDPLNPFVANVTTRNVLTWNGTSGINFTASNYSNLSSTQQTALGANAAAATDLINWLRGDQSKEGSLFRKRSVLLGDIVNSDPFFAGQEDLGNSVLPDTEGSSYLAFLNNNPTDTVPGKNGRKPMLYVGANDGMLHGINASSSSASGGGREVFAFMPKSVFPNLATLASPSYQHSYYVDGSPVVLDAYIGSPTPSWRSILVGSTGAMSSGSVFSIDVTNPSSISTSSVKWEYALTAPAAAMGQPVIARVNDSAHPWVAIFGNGYNSGDSTVKLLVVDLDTGVLVKAIDTKVATTSDGLSSPTAVDVDGNGITDYVYAGDLLGNMWKFDFTGDNSTWAISYGSASNPAPLFQAVDSSNNPQPITDAPDVGRNPQGGYMVYFGTGQYFAVGDNQAASNKTQTFYGIRDNGATVVRANLQAQTISAEGTVSGVSYRSVSNNSVNYATKSGWYIDLVSPSGASSPSERAVEPPILHNGRIIFTTTIPDSTSACIPGGKSWLMEVDALTGGALSTPVFDVNKDNTVDSVDTVVFSASLTTSPSGVGSPEIWSTPRIIGTSPTMERKLLSGSSGTISGVGEKAGGSPGRQSWRQLQ